MLHFFAIPDFNKMAGSVGKVYTISTAFIQRLSIGNTVASIFVEVLAVKSSLVNKGVNIIHGKETFCL